MEQLKGEDAALAEVTKLFVEHLLRRCRRHILRKRVLVIARQKNETEKVLFYWIAMKLGVLIRQKVKSVGVEVRGGATILPYVQKLLKFRS